jgi:outer membrane protein assembly factor BamB
VSSHKISGLSFILLVSLTLLPLTTTAALPPQLNILQTINLNQHLLWQYSLQDALGFVRLSANGRTVAVTTGSEPSTLTVLDGTTGQALWDFAPTGLAQENRTITALSVSADGEYLAIGTSGGSIYMFHRSSNTIVQTWHAYFPITAITLSELGTFLSIAFAGSLYYLRRIDGVVVWSITLALPPHYITNITTDQTGNHLAIGTSTPSLSFIFTSTEFYWNFSLIEPSQALQLNTEGNRILLTTQSYCVLLDQDGTIELQYPTTSRVFAFSGPGNRIALAPNETILIYSSSFLDPISQGTFTGETPTSLGITFDERVLLLGTISGTVYIINPLDFETLWSLNLAEPILYILTPNFGEAFLIATPTTVLILRISSVSGFFIYLLPVLVIVTVTIIVVIITILFLKPKRRRFSLTNKEEITMQQ